MFLSNLEVRPLFSVGIAATPHPSGRYYENCRERYNRKKMQGNPDHQEVTVTMRAARVDGITPTLWKVAVCAGALALCLGVGCAAAADVPASDTASAGEITTVTGSVTTAWREVLGPATDRQGVSMATLEDGSLEVVCPYFSLVLAADAAESLTAFCFDETFTALGGDYERRDDPSTWRIACQDLYLEVGGQRMGVYLNRLGEGGVYGDNDWMGVGIDDRYLGDASVGGGWRVVAYVTYDPAKEGDLQRAEAALDMLDQTVELRGSSAKAPVVPDDLVPVFGG